MAVAARRHYWTAEEYTAFENQSLNKHEYFNGEVFAMAGARPDHNELSSDVGYALGNLTRRRKCRTFTSDQRIYIPTTGLYTYADGGVRCGNRQLHTDGMCLLNPLLLVEVLSPSTRDYDLGEKLEHYKKIPSLRHVLLIDPEDRSIHHHHRGEGEDWQLTKANDGEIALPDLGGNIPVSEFFVEA